MPPKSLLSIIMMMTMNRFTTCKLRLNLNPPEKFIQAKLLWDRPWSWNTTAAQHHSHHRSVECRSPVVLPPACSQQWVLGTLDNVRSPVIEHTTHCTLAITYGPVRWPLFCHRRANAVEESAWSASTTGHHLRTIQTIIKNVYVWLAGSRRLVSEC